MKIHQLKFEVWIQFQAINNPNVVASFLHCRERERLYVRVCVCVCVCVCRKHEGIRVTSSLTIFIQTFSDRWIEKSNG